MDEPINQNTQAATTTTSGGAGDEDYKIPNLVMEKYPDLVELIKKTQSMSREERQYWFQILPIMTDEQVARLRKILEDEASQLAKLDEAYQAEVSELNKKHLAEWDAYAQVEREKEVRAEREKLANAEASSEATESQSEEELLKALQNIGDA